ncbi:MAG: class I SAM-dependent methyltransferase, partial [Candidatus Krumholzibacteriia bacterium]
MRSRRTWWGSSGSFSIAVREVSRRSLWSAGENFGYAAPEICYVPPMDPRTQDFYRRHARDLAARYRAAQGGVSDHFAEAFADCRRILDVGCGAGRDLARLLALGHDAHGADACREMVEATLETCRLARVDAGDRVVESALPALDRFADGEFDGVLCSAVLMHVPDEGLFDAVYGLRRVLRPGGRLLLSIPAEWQDRDPQACRDSDGRY